MMNWVVGSLEAVVVSKRQPLQILAERFSLFRVVDNALCVQK